MENNIITMQEKETIIENMKSLLREYDYDFKNFALERIVNTWAENKANLINLFKKHPNYVEGEFLIAFNKDYNRDIDVSGAQNFAQWICDNAEAIRENLPEDIKQKRNDHRIALGYTEEGYSYYYPIFANCNFLTHRSYRYAHQFVTEDLAELMNGAIPSLNIKVGQKTSRAINKLCTYLNINKHPDYNKEFAKFADSVNPLKIVRHTVISLNPLDYLTMSFGNSWASCHTIDKSNTRRMPNAYEGQYSSGTMSYMLDEVSMVFYTVDADYEGNEYYFEDKINRCMFHYGKDKLVQGRVYPQSNDSNVENIYKDLREIVQKIVADCEGMSNYWTTKKGTDEVSEYVWSTGTHYRDYTNYSNCCISFPKEKEMNYDTMTIGHNPICIECGDTHNVSENINCCAERHVCYNCGCVIDDDDSYWVHDERYCRDCVEYCDWCEEYELEDEVHWVESVQCNVCSDCLDNYFTYCERCGEYHRSENTTYLDNYDIYVCDSCLDEDYTKCDECGEYICNEDITYDSETDMHYCPECFEEMMENEEDDE